MNEQYNLNKELNNLVNLRYDQVVNSLRKLCTEESKNYMRDVSLNASKMYKNQSSNNVNTQNNNELKTDKGIKETNEEGEEKERENEEEQHQQIEERGEKEENRENEDLKGTTSRKESSKPISLHKKLTYEDGEEITASEDLVLTAQWTIKQYTIQYTLGGGTASNPATYTVETTTFSLTNPTRSGYTFTGWSGTDLTGTTIEYKIYDTFITDPDDVSILRTTDKSVREVTLITCTNGRANRLINKAIEVK